MMSALGGGPPKADDSTDKLRECDSDREEGVKKLQMLNMYMPPLKESLIMVSGSSTDGMPKQEQRVRVQAVVSTVAGRRSES